MSETQYFRMRSRSDRLTFKSCVPTGACHYHASSCFLFINETSYQTAGVIRPHAPFAGDHLSITCDN
ncbi:hypothetical protein TSMEX_011322 [Taenia solium]|eukprot:TsM_000333900 transcript=TsM_000333900 gene=TsM_000333900